jgi:dienelactone hydrolase
MNNTTRSAAELAVRWNGRINPHTRKEFRLQHTHERDLVLDVFYPAEDKNLLPAVITVSGYPEDGVQRAFGRSSREFRPRSSWCELLASEGIAAIAYEAHDPSGDLSAVVEAIRRQSTALRLDPDRVGLFACSGHVPTALGAMHSNPSLRCAALLYGFMLDTERPGHVAAAARQFGFANPTATLAVADLPSHAHLLIVRAGRDPFPGLNASVDAFIAAALTNNRPITVINHPYGVHSFDLLDDGRDTQHLIRSVIEFMNVNLAQPKHLTETL